MYVYVLFLKMRQRELDAIEAAAAKLRAEEEAKRQAEEALAAEVQRKLDELAAQQAAAAATPPPDAATEQTARPIEPGSAEWQFVDNAIELELAKIIFEHWNVCEDVYVKDSKHVFKNMRELRDQLMRHVHRIKQDLLAYMNRPDVK